MTTRRWNYQQLNSAVSIVISTLMMWSIASDLQFGNSKVLALQGVIISLVAVVAVWSLGQRHLQPTSFLPRMTFAILALGNVEVFISSDAFYGFLSILWTVVIPCFLMDKRVDTLFRYAPIA